MSKIHFTLIQGVTMAETKSKWSKKFWIDLGERVGSTLLYGLATWLTLSQTTTLDFEKLWPVVALPAVLSLIKGLAANLHDPESGASLVPAPPAAVVQPGAV